MDDIDSRFGRKIPGSFPKNTLPEQQFRFKIPAKPPGRLLKSKKHRVRCHAVFKKGKSLSGIDVGVTSVSGFIEIPIVVLYTPAECPGNQFQVNTGNIFSFLTVRDNRRYI